MSAFESILSSPSAPPPPICPSAGGPSLICLLKVSCGSRQFFPPDSGFLYTLCEYTEEEEVICRAGLTLIKIPNKTHLRGLPSRGWFPHLCYISEEKWCLNE